MPRHQKLPKADKEAQRTGANINYAIEKGIDFIFKCLDRKKEPQATPKPEPSPKPHEAEKVAPPLSTFIQEENAIHERFLEQRKAGKQILKRLK